MNAAILIDNRLYGYGPDTHAAWADFLRQISGAPHRSQAHMIDRAVRVHLSDEEASEVAEMVATPW
jgi:hypothetical protein